MGMLNPQTGTVCFDDGFVFAPDGQLSQTEPMADFGLHAAGGLRWKVLCAQAEETPLHAWIIPVWEGGQFTAVQIRAQLLNAFGLKEPEDREMHSFAVRFPFGTLMVCTEPYTGRSEVLLCYGAASEVAYHE